MYDEHTSRVSIPEEPSLATFAHLSKSVLVLKSAIQNLHVVDGGVPPCRLLGGIRNARLTLDSMDV
jgi:hypothetical protein